MYFHKSIKSSNVTIYHNHHQICWHYQESYTHKYGLRNLRKYGEFPMQTRFNLFVHLGWPCRNRRFHHFRKIGIYWTDLMVYKWRFTNFRLIRELSMLGKFTSTQFRCYLRIILETTWRYKFLSYDFVG